MRISDWSSDVCSSDLMVLNRHGLTPRGYVALHTGARHAINCWPLDHFYALAERLLAETSYDIVLFAGADARPGSALSDNPRVKIFDILDIDEDRKSVV